MESKIDKNKALKDYPVWIVFINIIRAYKVNDILNLTKLLKVLDYFIEYDRLLQYKSVLVRAGYLRSYTTFDVNILKDIPHGLTVSGNISVKNALMDRSFKRENLLEYSKYIPDRPSVKERTDSEHFSVKDDMEQDATVQNPSFKAASSMINKALQTNKNQILVKIDTENTHKEKLGHINDMRVELGITLRCKNVKQNIREGVMDFDFSGAEISISRLIVDTNKYEK